MKKFIAILLAAATLAATSIPAFAEMRKSRLRSKTSLNRLSLSKKKRRKQRSKHPPPQRKKQRKPSLSRKHPPSSPLSLPSRKKRPPPSLPSRKKRSPPSSQKRPR